MTTPVFIWFIAVIFSLIVTLIAHGTQTQINFFGTLIGTSFQVAILIWGGFFSTLGFPQAIYIALCLDGMVWAITKHGEYENVNFFSNALEIGLIALLFWWGGFFG